MAGPWQVHRRSTPPLAYEAGPHLAPLFGNAPGQLANVHPPDWVSPEPPARYNLVVIGAGTAGLVTAAGAAGLRAYPPAVQLTNPRHHLVVEATTR